jgi:hypothetical protein
VYDVHFWPHDICGPKIDQSDQAPGMLTRRFVTIAPLLCPSSNDRPLLCSVQQTARLARGRYLHSDRPCGSRSNSDWPTDLCGDADDND